MKSVKVAVACAAVFAAVVSYAGTVTRDITYDSTHQLDATHPTLIGDLYLPDRVDKNTQMVLLIHGGGWSGLDRASVEGIATFFQNDLGFAVFNIEYRLANADERRWPACGNDCVTAGNFILSESFKSAYGLSYDKIWICGGSSGGHLTLWTLVNLEPAKVRGAVSISSIGKPELDCAVNPGRYNNLFRHSSPFSEEEFDSMNPILRITGGMAPLLCTHATEDEVVPIGSHRAFADAYGEAGNSCEFFEYASTCEPNQGGHFIWRSGVSPHKLLACIEGRIRRFVQGQSAVVASDIQLTHNLFTRLMTTNANAVVHNLYSQGSLRKHSPGKVTLVAPGLGASGDITVEQGELDIDFKATPGQPSLPAALVSKAKIWLSADVNVIAENGKVVDWCDCRETDVSVETAESRTYPYASSRFSYMTEDRVGHPIDKINPPDYVANMSVFPYVDFGRYFNDDLRTGQGLSITNTGLAWGAIYAREVFVVFAKNDAGNFGPGTIVSYTDGGMSPPSWVGSTSYLWGTTMNCRADKGSTRLDREAKPGCYVPIVDQNWHLASTTNPNTDGETRINQLGIDRIMSVGGMKIGEIILFETFLSEWDRMRIEDYLWKKWFGGAQTTYGALNVARDATARIATSSDVRGSLAGGGTVEVSGGGTVTAMNRGFTGKLQVADGGCLLTDDLAVNIPEPTRKMTVYGDSGYIMTTPGENEGEVEVTGNGYGAFEGVASETKTLLMHGNGTFRLAPPVARGTVAAAATFPNHDMEAWENLSPGSSVHNFTGGSGACKTNENWVFDRSMYTDGGALVVVMFTNSYLNPAGSWNTQTRPDVGLGWDGRCWLYITKGALKGSFTVPKSGFYSVQFRASSRSSSAHKDITLKIDGQEVRHITSFIWTQFLRDEIELPYLTAGKHEISFVDEAVAGETYTFDDVKILPRRIVAEEPVKVAIANPSFEEPLSNQGKATSELATIQAFIPKQDDCTGWTITTAGVTPSSSQFVQNWIRRRWFEGVSAANYGMLAVPEEFPDGFLGAHLPGDAIFSQTVTIPSPGRYRLTYWLAKRTAMSPQLVEAKVGDKVVKRVWTHDVNFKRYVAEFDLAESGETTLSFAGKGDATSSTLYARGDAWLDDISLERIGDVETGNLIANPGFENGSTGWLLAGGAKLVSQRSKWAGGDTLPKEAAISGTDAVLVDSANSAVRQIVNFPATGRYELSFNVRQIRYNPTGKTTTTLFKVGVSTEAGSTNTLYSSYYFDNSDERRMTLPFVINEAGDQTVEFYIVTPNALTDYVIIDDVKVVAAPLADRTDLAEYLPPDLDVKVTALNGSPKVILDFDGTAQIGAFSYVGKRYTGEISHRTLPTVIFGRGKFYVRPKGTVLIVK